jgi:hypothetical protein
MYYIGLDIHKKTISYCVKDQGGQICSEGVIAAHAGRSGPKGENGARGLYRSRRLLEVLELQTGLVTYGRCP